jgi:hypothetical protein
MFWHKGGPRAADPGQNVSLPGDGNQIQEAIMGSKVVAWKDLTRNRYGG